MAVFVLSKLEKMLKRIIPEAVYSFMMPCIALAVMTPLSLLVIGPVLTTAANGLATAYEMIADIPILAGIQFIVRVKPDCCRYYRRRPVGSACYFWCSLDICSYYVE